MQHTAKKVMRGGFTLIEILVVLVIMGFLVALVAPKLSGIVDSAVDTNCDTNQERLRKVLNTFVQQNNALPGGLTNMVVVNTDATRAIIPSENDGNKANGAETLSDEFTERYKPQVHYLDAAEADELIGMGQNAVFNLKRTSEATLTAPVEANTVEENFRTPIAAGLPVMMAGFGIDDTGTAQWATGQELTVTGSAVTETAAGVAINAGTLSTDANADGTYVRMDEGRHVGRIVFGVANTNELIHNGMLDESGTCPGQLQNEDMFDWGNYTVLMPRLGATVDRLDGEIADGEANLHAIALSVDTGESPVGNTIAGRTPPGGYPQFTAQELRDHTTSCPEGHTWGAPADSFGIAVN